MAPDRSLSPAPASRVILEAPSQRSSHANPILHDHERPRARCTSRAAPGGLLPHNGAATVNSALAARDRRHLAGRASAKIVGKLERALRAERRQGLAGHWSYDLARHTRLLWAYRAEAAAAGLAAAGAARASIAGANPRAAPPSHPVAGRTAEPISRGGCRGPFSWRDPSGRARSSAQPSDSRAADPTFPGIPPGTDCSGSANDASMT